MFDLEKFVAGYVTKRSASMFLPDIEAGREKLSEAVTGRSVLVIGGAGSIGSSFIKAILPFQPSELVVADTNENALAELTRDLRSGGMLIPDVYLTYPMDYSSRTFRRMFRSRRGFDITANFAAHKHVRSEKDIFSVEALLRNNVINAKELLDLLSEYPPETYFCVSTDKAANPVNLMGASKRMMEDLIFSYSGQFPVKPARIANVAFSNGSLSAGFLERIQKRQPLSAPSGIRRYFVSPQESGQICMLSAILGKNREIFYPKLEEAQMMGFDMIAQKLLKVHGYEALECASESEAVRVAGRLEAGATHYPVCFSRPDTSGEKLTEEFYTNTEKVDEHRYEALGVITGKPAGDRQRISGLIRELEQAFDTEHVTKEQIVHMIENYLPEFHHMETGKSLDEKM